MLPSSICRAAVLAALHCVFHISLLSQTITYQTPDDFFVCGSATFDVTVTNTTGAALQGVTLSVDFTTNTGADCGMAYLPGTVTGAAESNISNLGNPVFALATLAPGAAVTVGMLVEAPCSVVDCIDDAEFFVNQIALNWTGGSTSVTTNPYIVERALLVITQVNSSFMTGSQGDLLTRRITIVNTRPGALQGFLFTDTHQGGISILSPNGTVVPAGPDAFQIALNGSDFANVGDGDGLFELNESIVITEFIRILDCGVDVSSTVSNLTAGWGCGGEICQEVSKVAIIDIGASQKAPNLIWEPITIFGDSFCGPEPSQQGMKITNVGTGAALDLVFDLLHTGNTPGWVTFFVDTASIEVDSAGTLLAIQPGNFGFTPLLSPPCTGTTNGVTSGFILTIPRLGPSQSLTVFWDAYPCDTTRCKEPRMDWAYRWSYFKECPPAPFVNTQQYIFVSDIGAPPMISSASIPPPGLLEDDGTYTVLYTVNYDSLTLLNHEMVVEINLPCGAVWHTDNDLILAGQAPISIEVETNEDGTLVTAVYQLPLPSSPASTTYDFTFDCESLCLDDNVCKDTLISSCQVLPCGQSLSPNITIEHIATLNKYTDLPLECNRSTCAPLVATYECAIDSLCINQPPGYVRFSHEAFRTNYGQPDNDDNRLPDGLGPVDLSKVARHRLIAGDSLRVSMGGEVVMDEPFTTLPFGFVDVHFDANAITTVNQGQFTQDGTGISRGEAFVRIFDASLGNYFTCNNPVPSVEDGGELLYRYDVSANGLAGCLPPGFEYGPGDSIIFEGNYRMIYNMVRENDLTPMSALLRMRPSVFVFDENTEQYDSISCNCSVQDFEVSAYEYTLLPGVFGLPPCDTSTFMGGSLFRLELASGNFFPFEYRNLVYADDWRLSIPNEITLVEAKMTFLRYQGGNALLNNQPLIFDFANGVYAMDIGQYQTPPVDEGFSFLMQYRFLMDCDVAGSRPLTIRSHLDFLDSMPEANDPLEMTITANALQALIPQLNLQALNYDLISFDDQLKIELFLKNEPTSASGQSSDISPNTWLYVTSQTGLVTDIVLINPATGQPFPSVNGVYQLGDLPVSTDTLLLCGTNKSCEKETIIVHYGWNCDPFTSQVQAACYRRSRLVTIESPPGEIDFLVESPTGCFDLCATTPPYSLQIFNGDLGAVYELTAQAQLPLGQTIVPGSSQVEYPSGSGNFFPVDDPVFFNITLAQWDLWKSTSLSNGLPGVSAAPANSITLTFETVTECGFIAGAFPLFSIAAQLNCGLPSNTVAKPGDPLCINGISQPYATNIQVEAEPGFGCADEVRFEFSMTASQTLPAGACVIVTLPPGISFVPGSCLSACQNNFNCTPMVEGNNYTWQLPVGVAANQITCFSFATVGWSSLGCEEGLVIFRTANETQALCAATGDLCSTKVSTGSLLFPYDIQQPAFSLADFMVSASQTAGNDLVNFSIGITNCGPPNEPPITVDFYLDTDGDGSGDQLVHSQNLIAVLSNCQAATLSGSFSLPPGNLCRLVAYLNPDQCACSVDSAFVAFPISYQTDQSLTVCSGESQTIGVPAMPGFAYQWLPAACLVNPNVASTVFNCTNNTPVPVPYAFTLSETDGGACLINNLISVTVQPVPGIAFAETPICAGQQANLAATDGATFLWQGPGISDPTLQVQTVAPAATSTYSVTVADAFGCMGTDMVTVEVNAAPSVDAGEDIFACPGAMPQLIATFNPAWNYLWSPTILGGLPTLSNPVIHNPFVVTTQNATFTLTVTDASGCTASDAVNVSLSGALNLVISPDVTICTGSSTTLTVSGGQLYDWSPGGTCLDPFCASISVSPTLPTTFTVVASTTDGCLDSASVTVTPTMDDLLAFDTLQICAGENVLIHGMLVSIPGTYLDTVLLAAGCDSISSITLLVSDPALVEMVDGAFCEGGNFEFNGTIYSHSGIYTDTLAGESGCDSIVYVITISETVLEMEIVGPYSVSPGDTITLQIVPAVFDSVVWSGGGMGPACDNVPECEDVVGESQIYTAVVVDENGCMAMDTHAVLAVVRCFPEKAEVPNVFTPNGDQVNDVFGIVSQDAEVVLKMRIWDRWGGKVYDGPGPWDGTYKGKPAASDVYIYDIVVGCPVSVEADENQLRGDVTLLR